jgi:hypothetical protein
VDGKSASAVLDNGEKKVIFENRESDDAVEELILGSRKRECDSFVGCIKDLVSLCMQAALRKHCTPCSFSLFIIIYDKLLNFGKVGMQNTIYCVGKSASPC